MFSSVTRAVLVVWLVAALLLSMGTLSAQAQQDAPSKLAQEPVTVEPVAEDDEISQRLQRILKSTGWFTAPRVTVRDGIATLDGQADTHEHQAWAGELAEKTEGTIAVINRITVDADVSSTFGRTGEEVARLYRQTVESWPLIVLSLVILAVAWFLSVLVAKLARRFLAPRIQTPLLLDVIARAVAIPIFLLGLYFVLQAAGLTRLALTVLGGTGLAGIIVGFAFRDIAENFLASILLSVRNPFRSGDLIEVAGHTGIVQNLNTRSSVLLTLDGNHVQIPNATVYKSTIKNFSSIPSRRAGFTVGIGYDSSTAKAQRLISQILEDHPAVLDKPEPLVLVDELGDATVNLRIYYWYDSATYSPIKINSALLRLSKNALLKGGIELPDPAREVVFPKGVPVVQMDGAKKPARAPAQPGEPSMPKEEDSAVTPSEGDLANEEAEVSRTSKGSVPESEENFLKE